MHWKRLRGAKLFPTTARQVTSLRTMGSSVLRSLKPEWEYGLQLGCCAVRRHSIGRWKRFTGLQ